MGRLLIGTYSRMHRPMTADATRSRPSNEVKFETRNPVVQRMIGGFFDVLRDVVGPLNPRSTLDAGCGEGETIERLAPLLGDRVSAIDISSYSVDRAAERLPEVDVSRGSVTELPFPDDSFDLVLCLEVIEHLDDPRRAVRELARVARRDIVVSVPYEPWFRLGSLARGKYLRSFGNHPEHVNHFNRRTLVALLEPTLEISAVEVAFPWLIAHGRVRSDPADAAAR
jgi:SAM-dependent methyltransferase